MTYVAHVFLPILEICLLGCLLVAAFGCAAGVAALDHYVDSQLNERLAMGAPILREWHQGRTMAELEEGWDEHFACKRRVEPASVIGDEIVPQPLRAVVSRTASADPFRTLVSGEEML